MRNKTLIFFTLIITVVISTYCYSQQDSIKDKGRSNEQKGFITILVEPNDASVFIDSSLVQIGDLIKYPLRPGLHWVTVRHFTRSNYLEHRIFITSNNEIKLRASLTSTNWAKVIASAEIPGMGQNMDGYPKKGLIVFGVFSLSVSYVLIEEGGFLKNRSHFLDANSYYMEQNRYQELINAKKEALSRYDNMYSSYKRRNVALIMFGCLYFFNIVDTYLFHSSPSEMEVITQTNVEPTLTYDKRFNTIKYGITIKF